MTKIQSPPAQKADTKQRRLSAALKRNMLRRKAQSAQRNDLIKKQSPDLKNLEETE